jgi:DtxR family Mn-dependent transcriptional regulator
VDENIIDELLNGKYIIKEGNKIKLTDTGEDLGKQLTRRHRLTERLLADVLDFNRQDIEKIACDLEHNLSTDLADSICTLLGHPKQCPHGNPIPEGNCCKNSSSKIESIVVPLSKIDIAEEVTLSYIVTTNHDYMHKLLSLGMVPGTKLKLHQKFPTYIVKVNETQIALDGEVANLIYVRK